MAFEEMKQRQAVMWGSGPFERVESTIADMHDVLAERLSIQPGERVLDIGCGTGALTFRLARQGADVTGLDLAPVLIATARRRADAEGLAIRYDTGDCEQLPYEYGAFDVVASSVGVMFSPDHRAAARELVRVTREGGRIGLTSWRSQGGMGKLFRALAAFSPPPEPGAGGPLEWGSTEYVRGLLGDEFELTFEQLDSPLVAGSGQEVWDSFSANFGPVKTLAESLDGDQRAGLQQAFIDLHETGRMRDGIRYSRSYLLTLGRRH